MLGSYKNSASGNTNSRFGISKVIKRDMVIIGESENSGIGSLHSTATATDCNSNGIATECRMINVKLTIHNKETPKERLPVAAAILTRAVNLEGGAVSFVVEELEIDGFDFGLRNRGNGGPGGGEKTGEKGGAADSDGEGGVDDGFVLGEEVIDEVVARGWVIFFKEISRPGCRRHEKRKLKNSR
nr:hypothetical protein Iba_chr11aCG2140 [Ipomoea batatas]